MSFIPVEFTEEELLFRLRTRLMVQLEFEGIDKLRANHRQYYNDQRNISLARDIDKVYPYLKESNNFIIYVDTEKGSIATTTIKQMEEELVKTFSMPFPVCTFEFRNSLNNIPIRIGAVRPESSMQLSLWGMTIVELSPNKLAVLYLMSYDELRINKSYLNVGCEFVDMENKANNNDVQEFFRLNILTIYYKINTMKTGEEQKNIKFKVGSGKGKFFHKIKRVIYMCDKKESIPSFLESEKINWSHCWEVRGHWRAIEGIGKNRFGEYKVENKTWVIPHVRGDETKPLIKKLRIMKGIQNGKESSEQEESC
jgi:hypothetical protein